jgi:hypothetical protein
VNGSSGTYEMVVAMLYLGWDDIRYHDLAEILQTECW